MGIYGLTYSLYHPEGTLRVKAYMYVVLYELEVVCEWRDTLLDCLIIVTMCWWRAVSSSQGWAGWQGWADHLAWWGPALGSGSVVDRAPVCRWTWGLSHRSHRRDVPAKQEPVIREDEHDSNMAHLIITVWVEHSKTFEIWPSKTATNCF